jgi:RNA polymerase sigma-70 factor (ECF subfamily)
LTGNDATRRFYDALWPHAALVLRVATILTGNATEADDLAQETLLKAFRSIDRFAIGTDAKAWLLAILRNTRIDRLRANAASAANVSLDLLAGDPAAEPVVAEDEWNEPQEILQSFEDAEVISALQSLPEEIRWTLLLVDVEGLDHAEAAGILDVPLGTIKSRSHRGRAMLRAALLPLARERRLVE